MKGWWLAAALGAAIGALGCGGGSSTPDADDDATDTGDGVDDTTDTGDVPVDGIDDTTDGDDTADGADATPEAKRTVITPTSGGGNISSANYQMRVYVGTPQPMGSAAGTDHRAGFGPGAQANQ